MIRSVLLQTIRRCQTTNNTMMMMNIIPKKAATTTRTGGHGGRMLASSAKPHSPLEADTGRLGTHQHHLLTTILLLATPVYALVPLEDVGGQSLRKLFDGLLAGSITMHSWVGLNYVATDYVPKLSKALLGPARIVNAALAVTTFVGLARIALNDKGGIKACVTGLWTKKSTTTPVTTTTSKA